MADYLAVPQHRQERAVHEKARSARRGELRWLRSYIDDLVNDPTMFAESLFLRGLDQALLHLAAKHGWIIPLDTRWIGAQINVRARDIGPGVKRLLELERLELVAVSDENRNGSGIQPALFSTVASTLQDPRRIHAGSTQDPFRPTLENGEGLEESRVAAQTASQRLAQTRSREELDLERSIRQETEERPEISNETNPVVHRLIAIAKLPPASHAFIHTEAQGLPDASIVSIIESYLNRRPRPSNPAGWIVNALRQQRTERTEARAVVDDPEPEL